MPFRFHYRSAIDRHNCVGEATFANHENLAFLVPESWKFDGRIDGREVI